jgi:cobalt-zinc-cadmium efflux system outer membrane protein
VRTARAATPASEGLTLAEAVRLMRERNPEIREARAAYAAARREADVKTPPPNPTIGLGPLLFGGADVLTSGTWGVTAALGWVVPLARKTRLADDVSAVRAERARAEVGAAERTEYLGLRRAFVQAALAQDRLETERGLAAEARAAAGVARDLAEAGQASSIDMRLLRLDAARAEADVATSAEESAERRHDLAAHVGIAAGGLPPPTVQALPPLPPALPGLRALEDAALEGHPRLAVLRAAYLVAEKELRLEAARAIPDLSMGLELEVEGENYLSLPLGIEIPVFDRNQGGIARALGARDEARARFRAAVERMLAAMATAHARVSARMHHLRRLEEHVAPEADGALAATRSALSAGGTDALRYLEVLRTARAVSLEVRDARAALYGAWSDLEGACGLPLLRFPHEPGGAWPAPLPLPPPPEPANEETDQ